MAVQQALGLQQGLPSPRWLMLANSICCAVVAGSRRRTGADHRAHVQLTGF